jgi:hypothetical protein
MKWIVLVIGGICVFGFLNAPASNKSQTSHAMSEVVANINDAPGSGAMVAAFVGIFVIAIFAPTSKKKKKGE